MPKTNVGAGCAVAVFNSKREFVLLKRGTQAHAPGVYCLPGGWIEDFETMLDAGRREVMEEIGCRVKAIKVVGVADTIMKNENHHTLTALMVAVLEDGEEPKNIEPEKCSEILTLPYSKLGDLPNPFFTDYAANMSVFEVEKFLDEHTG